MKLPEPSGGLPRVAFRLRTEGPKWLLRRLGIELTLPSTPPGKALHALLRNALNLLAATLRALKRIGAASPPAEARTLYAFYDLKVAPITFDFLWFLAGADLRRRQQGLERVHVVIVPGPYKGLRLERTDYEGTIDLAARRWRIENILIPACGMLPACAGVTRAASRDEAAFLRARAARHVYPAGYELALPNYPGPSECLDAARHGEREIGVLRAPPDALRVVDRWIAGRSGGRRSVTITLRDYAYMPARNSNLEAWIAFARRLDGARYLPIFVPDTEQTVGDIAKALRDFALFPEAAWNLGLRMALYERAYLNLGVNNGPMGLCWLNDRTRYITCKIETPSVPQATRDYMRALGFEIERSLPFAGRLQQWLWEDDTLEVIERAFEAMVARAEADEGNGDS